MTEEEQRDVVVRLATTIRNGATLPAGYHLAVVVTDQNGSWVGVSSTADDEYCAQLLLSALNGADYHAHVGREIVTDGEAAP